MAVEARPGVQLAEVAAAITLAADLGVGQPLEHVLRACALTIKFAERLPISDEERTATYWVALFMIPGCTAVSYELSQVFGDDIALRAAAYSTPPSALEQMRYVLGRAGGDRNLLAKTRIRLDLIRTGMSPLVKSVAAHCSINQRLAATLGLGETVTKALSQSFSRWDGKGLPAGLAGQDIALPVRIASIADVVEVAHREGGIDGAIASARLWGGKRFDPELVEAWCGMAPKLFEAVEGDAARQLVMSARPNRRLNPDELEAGLELLADYADLKSPWFLHHSRSVAGLAEAAARGMGLPEDQARTVRHAALVHDLGRSGVPNSIWDKPGPLSEDEWEKVRLHPYQTGRILQRAGSFAYLAPIASAAHERVDGRGYPRAISGSTIPLPGRILACANSYQAMVEARPYRPALTPRTAASELRKLGREGALDAAAVDAVLAAAGHPARRRALAPGGLTPREIEVLELAARGATAKQVALRLGISPKTAGNHIERIYEKVGVSSRAEAALYAMQHGLVRGLET